MKALYEYFLMVVSPLLLNRVYVLKCDVSFEERDMAMKGLSVGVEGA